VNILSKFRSKKPEPTKAPEKQPGPRTKTLVLSTYQYLIHTKDRIFKITRSDSVGLDWAGCTVDLKYAENPAYNLAIEIDENTFLPISAVQLIKRKIIHQEKITYDLDKIKEGCSPEEAIIESETIDPTATE